MTSFSPIVQGSWIGMGTFPLASPFSRVDPSTASSIVNHYLDEGGYYIDTAPTYAHGEVETLVGNVVRTRPRESFFINTSCGWVRRGEGYELSGDPDDVQADLERSLERLGLNYVDSYLSHMPDPKTPFASTVSALQHAKDRGLVRHIGVSNVTLPQLREYSLHGDIEFVQNRFSLINRSHDSEFLTHCRERGIAIMAYQVIERGLLTQRPNDDLGTREDDLRSRKPEFRVKPKNLIREWVRDTLRPLADALGTTTQALAIRWAADQPGVAITQVGASTPDQLRAIVQARNLRLDESTKEQVESAYEIFFQRALQAGYISARDVLGLEGGDPFKAISMSGR